MRLLSHLLGKAIVNGRLTLIDHAGARESFGSGENGPHVTVRLGDRAVARQIFANPELKVPEAYMDGRLTVEAGGSIHDLVHLHSVNRERFQRYPLQAMLHKFGMALRAQHQANPVGVASENASSHYDHSAAFYQLWLDDSMAYSCAYFEHPGQSLEEAQLAKFRHIAAKLDLAPGMTVAEIGSGWGGLAIYLARHCGARVTGFNVAKEQLVESRERAAAAGLSGQVAFVEEDYRLIAGAFDRVVSVGMLEHVGAVNYDAYFAAVRRMLAPGGWAMIHTICRMSPPEATSPFIRKYIFPGGYVPAPSEVFAAVERAGLWASDGEFLRLHYYYTLRAWRLRFAARRAEIVAMKGERFARMWEFYLSASEFEFLNGSHMVMQLLLAETRDAVPLTRDFIGRGEERLRPAGSRAVSLPAQAAGS